VSDEMQLARPYAQALFELALTDHTIEIWDHFLKQAAILSLREEVKKFLSAPQVSTSLQVACFVDLLLTGKNQKQYESLFEKARNLLQLLADNRRLLQLPFIAHQFKALCDNYESVLEVEVCSAITLSSEQENRLLNKLTARYQKKIHLSKRVVPDLLGGLVVRTKEGVIDASLRNQLDKLAHFIEMT